MIDSGEFRQSAAASGGGVPAVRSGSPDRGIVPVLGWWAVRAARCGGSPRTVSRPARANRWRREFPLVAAESDLAANGDVAPADVSAGSSRPTWWRCREGHTWRAQVAARTVRRRDRVSDVHPVGLVAQVELGLRHEIAVVLPVVHYEHPPLRVDHGRPVRVDILVQSLSLRLAVEYDGQYWHGTATSWERDRRRTQRLEAAGWTVVGVGDHLAPMGAKDVVITTRVGAHERAAAVVDQLVALGFNMRVWTATAESASRLAGRRRTPSHTRVAVRGGGPRRREPLRTSSSLWFGAVRGCCGGGGFVLGRPRGRGRWMRQGRRRRGRRAGRCVRGGRTVRRGSSR